MSTAHFCFMRWLEELFIYVSALLPQHLPQCFRGRPQHLSPPPASTGKQRLYLHRSFPATNVNRQPIKEAREMGAHRGKTESKEYE